MRLSKRGEVWHATHTTPDGQRFRFSTRCTGTRVEAEEKAWELLKELQAERKPVQTVMTLKQALERTYNEHWDHLRSARSYLQSISLVTRDYGDTTLDSIDEDWLQELVTVLRQRGNSGATINRRMSLIQTAMRHAQRWRETRDTFRLPQFPHQRESAGRVRYFTDDEERVILADIQSRKGSDENGMAWAVFEKLVIVLVDTGARLSEALRITQDDVRDGQVTITGTKHKRGKVRYRAIPLTTRAQAALEWLFDVCGPRPLQAWNADKCRRRWDTVRESVGLADDPEAVLHVLRHTCASRLVQNGVPLTSVRDWLGHSTITVTERYAHLAPSALRGAVAALETRSDQAASTPLRRVK